MIPLTLLGPQKLANLLTSGSALQTAVTGLAKQSGVVVPSISNNQVIVTSMSPDMADKNAQLTYPRVCIYALQIRNSQNQKFCSFSGAIALAADIWFSSNLLPATGIGLHYYIQAISSILQANEGDWGDGFYFSGMYDVQLQPAKAGGFGFVESARVTCTLEAHIS